MLVDKLFIVSNQVINKCIFYEEKFYCGKMCENLFKQLVFVDLWDYIQQLQYLCSTPGVSLLYADVRM